MKNGNSIITNLDSLNSLQKYGDIVKSINIAAKILKKILIFIELKLEQKQLEFVLLIDNLLQK